VPRTLFSNNQEPRYPGFFYFQPIIFLPVGYERKWYTVYIMQRRNKQAFIIFVYLLLFGGFCTGVFFFFLYQTPTCLDGKRNQDETGIDCGGACGQYCIADLASQPLVITDVEALAYGATSSDAIGNITNKNTKAALRSGTYTFRASDQSGAVVAEATGKFSLLPGESRTVAELGLAVPQNQITKIELVITDEDWVAFTDFTEPPNILVVNQQFSLLAGQAGYAEARGLLQNSSPYDIRTLGIVVVVRDDTGKALSVNKTTMNTLQSGERRDFRLVWPQSFSGTPANTDMQVHFDMLVEDAFVQQYFPGGEFQSLNQDR
jgi:hypothetical protein